MVLIRGLRMVEVRTSAWLLIPIRAICHLDRRDFLQMDRECNPPLAYRILSGLPMGE